MPAFWHNGGMNVKHFAHLPRSFWGLGQGPSGEVQEAGGGLLPQSARARSPRIGMVQTHNSTQHAEREGAQPLQKRAT